MTGKPKKPIRILHAGLDDYKGDIILRGTVDPESLADLLVDDYQREALPISSLGSMMAALREGTVFPDIELGMRGHQVTNREDTFLLKDPVYIVDGQQRVNACIQHLLSNPDAQVRLGATIHFGTNRDWERQRFLVTNTGRLKVSPNVILRNTSESSPAIRILRDLTAKDEKFALKNRVCWNQRMARGEFISALTLAKVAGRLHSHKVAGTRSTQIKDLVPALDKVVEVFGPNVFRDNIRAFTDLLDDCWGVKRVQFKESAFYMRGTFLLVLGKMLCDHTDFWRDGDKRLFVDSGLRRKIALFPVNDPEVTRLAASGGKAHEVLYMMMFGHVNSGKRTKRLTQRSGVVLNFNDGANGADDEEGDD